ncbi:nuclease-related domain-containing protein [Psychrobacter sp. ANT_WB68]|uniref:nuclease-related domain-containing protein n=1 Tax=Psychrobacter sp. ANT_WB68 TaxID=2597355 RepID=UPI0011F3A2B3|nr:NERD domain-containing protein [Psychrobacter sp. ANT_WB68]KAA0915307.1 DNA topoisomerase I [Psychrobacter sp. ANT_WB68]
MSLMSTFKGILGETVINVAMWLKLEKDVYHRLNNITLPLANGGSTQIDHIIVSVYGIFVIETKNYKGWIFGNEKQRQWTQVIMGRKYKFQNPLHQNYLHIKTLADLLELELSYFHPMIAFIGECELKTRDELPEHVLTSGMTSYVKKKQETLLTDEEVITIVEQIESNRFIKSWRTNRAHKAYLKDKHSQSNKPTSNNSNAKSVIRNTPEPIVKEPPKKTILQSSEVLRWSGQTQVEQADTPVTPFIDPQPSNEQLNNGQLNDDEVFITPFEVLESELKINKPFIIEQVDVPIVSDNIPACPKCHGQMIQRVVKKGARQGQIFYGCRQFPKCRGVVNKN